MVDSKKIKEQIKDLKENMKSRESWAIFLGAGASADVDFPTMKKLTELTLSEIKGDNDLLLIKEIVSILGEGKKEGINIEDILNVCYQLLNLIKDKKGIKIEYGSIKNITEKLIDNCIVKIKEICLRECLKDYSLDIHYEFLKFWLSGTKEIDIFTTNWDFLVEKASDQLIKVDEEDIRCLDGFKGSYTKTLDLNIFDEEIKREKGYIKKINLYKLHGSVNWVLEGEKIIMSYKTETTDEKTVMIFPTPQKYQEVLGFPYIELLRRFSNVIENKCRYLLVIGYSFQDLHINSIIKESIKNPGFNLYIIDPELKYSYATSLFGEHRQIREPINLKFKDFIKQITSETIE
ncbi:MAG: hypothetical protein COX40_06365 [Candidatus Omnitrophica bacterium CG23_combo_of_CG06-09_8_20_14_all_40_11]|nr:MAG: hypothetical protein COX40_06365 [Candidatus Omnitrophica bacterium CG23_combo_of_CG06-09_8_20_14_all_40_11]